MQKQWPIWLFVIGVVVVVLFALNYQGANEVISMRDLFPDVEMEDAGEIEYEFVTESGETIALEQAPLAAPSMPVAVPRVPLQTVTSNILKDVTAESVSEEVDLSGIPFTIQISSSKDKDRAQAALKKIKAAGYPAYLVSKDLGKKGVWYRTYVGKFATKAQAREYLSTVKKDYKDSFIITPHKKK